MKRRRIGMQGALIVTAAVCVAVLIWAKFGQGGGALKEAWLENEEIGKNQEKITAVLLRDTGLDKTYSAEAGQEILTSFGDMTGDGRKDAVITLAVTPEDSVAAVYAGQANGGYLYLGLVGEFFAVERVEFLALPGLDREAVLLREHTRQDSGLYEETVMVRGYAWDGEDFQLVLNLPQDICACWSAENTQLAQWEKVEQVGALYYFDTPQATIQVRATQKYLTTQEGTGDEIPAASAFQTAQERVVEENYIWNAAWGRFVLEEAKDLDTGESVAVLEDLAHSPYVLVEDFSAQAGFLRVCYADGTTGVVDRDTLEVLP